MCGSLLPVLLGTALLAAHAGDIYNCADDNGSIVLTNLACAHPGALVVRDDARQPDAPVPVADPYSQHVADAAREQRLDKALIEAVIAVESGNAPGAVSRKGAIGLMQLMPQTAKRFGALDATDPAQNIRAGARYLRYLLDIFRGDLELALAAYNAGEGNVLRHGTRVPPFPETIDYVRKVRARYQAAARE